MKDEKYEQMELFYRKPNGNYKYWYRIYRFYYDCHSYNLRCLP
jgi:hypothetical protein